MEDRISKVFFRIFLLVESDTAGVFFSHFFAREKPHRWGVFSHFFARAKKRSQRNHAKTFFPGKKVLESQKGVVSAPKLTLMGTGTDGKAV